MVYYIYIYIYIYVCMEKVRCNFCNAPGHQVIFRSTASTA